jgi:hypothetical protein
LQGGFLVNTKKLFVGCACVLAASCAAVAGPQIKFTSVNAWGGSSGGGPFEVEAIGFAPAGLGLHGAAAGRFITFCVETNEYIQDGKTYDVVTNTSAISGGSGGPSPDPLDSRTAFLYTMFMNGTLDTLESSFTYLNAASGEALQDAIWSLEDEISSPSSGSLAGKLIALAQSNVDSGSWTGIGNVRILNLTRNGEKAQDQLVMLPTPIPLPSAAGLAAVGLGLVSVRRRRR